MNEKRKTLLHYLNSFDEALTLHELFQTMTLDDRELFRNMDDISYTLNSLRDKKLWIKNGPEKTANNKTFLTWTITEKGKHALQTEQTNPLVPVETVSDIDPAETTEETITAADPLDFKKCRADTDTTMEIEDPLAFYDSVQDSVRAMLEVLLKQKPAQTIRNKQSKIAVLMHFRDFAQPMNVDWVITLADIIQDLHKLDEATNDA